MTFMRSRAIGVFMLVYASVLSNVCANALTITGVSHSPSYIIPGPASLVNISFRLSAPSRVTLKLYDDREILIKAISNDLEAGDNTMAWDLSDNAGKPVPAEAYRYTLTAENENNSVVYDASDLTGNVFIDVENVNWDRQAGEISFALQKAARVSLNIGILEGGPLLGTILDWVPRKRGKHAVKWNGMDPTGSANVGKIKDIAVVAQAFALSDNAIIIGPDVNRSRYIADITWDKVSRERSKTAKPHIYNYAAKAADKRRNYKIEMILPGDLSRTDDGWPILHGRVPVRINLASDDRDRMQQDRFESILFLDGKYVSELETGFFPLTWQLDASLYEPGAHYLTVNIRGYDGQNGSATRYIYIENPNHE